MAAVVVEIVRIRMGMMGMTLMKVMVVTGHMWDGGSAARCVMGLMDHLRRAATLQTAGTRTGKRNRRGGRKGRKGRRKRRKEGDRRAI